MEDSKARLSRLLAALDPAATMLCLCLLSCPVVAADSSPNPPSAGDVALRMISERPLAYRNVCVAKDPSMRAGFEAALADLRARVEAIGRPLLNSAQFSSLNRVPAPRELVEAVREQSAALEKQISGAEVARDCPTFLASIARIDGETLRDGITQVLGGVQQTLAAMNAAAR